jgi:GDP-mannose 6-dehydrogenase
MKISIFGLGYVGAVSLACLVRDGHSVIGVDIDSAKLDLILAGKTPVVEEGLVALMGEAATSGRLSVTSDVCQAVQDSDLSLICVGTPSAQNGSQNQQAILDLAKDLGAAIRHKTAKHVFVFRSTLVPGTVEGVLRPIMEERSQKKDGVEFHICFQPEFLREGTSIKDYDKPPFTIIGANSEFAVASLRQLFGHLPCDFLLVSVRAAEMVKYSCNNFHALKITFANETARLCEALGVDPFQVMEIICKDRQLNISPAYLKPGFAFGGSCLPKDLRATLHLSKIHDVDLPMHASIAPSNRAHIDHAISKVLSSGKRRIGMIGLSFKTGTDDLRESPMVLLAEHFIGKGLSLHIYDPEVHLSQLLGANRRFIEQHVPHVSDLIKNDLDFVIDTSDVLVLGLNDQRIFETLSNRVRNNQLLLDLVGMPQRNELRCVYAGLCW